MKEQLYNDLNQLLKSKETAHNVSKVDNDNDIKVIRFFGEIKASKNNTVRVEMILKNGVSKIAFSRCNNNGEYLKGMHFTKSMFLELLDILETVRNCDEFH